MIERSDFRSKSPRVLQKEGKGKKFSFTNYARSFRKIKKEEWEGG